MKTLGLNRRSHLKPSHAKKPRGRGILYSIVRDAPFPFGGLDMMRSPLLHSPYMTSQQTGIRWFGPG